jgi:hypothetical protein
MASREFIGDVCYFDPARDIPDRFGVLDTGFESNSLLIFSLSGPPYEYDGRWYIPVAGTPNLAGLAGN